MKDSFIEKELAEHYSDLLFQVSINGNRGLIYFLFEYKSYPDKVIAFQLLKYMAEIWIRELEKENDQLVPIIIPIIIYQGKRKWEKPKTILDWHGGREHVIDSFIKIIPNFEMLYFDFSKHSDIEIRGTTKLKAYLQLIKYIYHDDSDRLYSIIVQLDEAGELSYFETAIIYILNVKESISIESMKERLTVEGRKKLMTMAEKLREEGRLVGREEGEKLNAQRVARKMLMRNVDEQEIMMFTELTRAEIEEIKRTLE